MVIVMVVDKLNGDGNVAGTFAFTGKTEDDAVEEVRIQLLKEAEAEGETDVDLDEWYDIYCDTI